MSDDDDGAGFAYVSIDLHPVHVVRHHGLKRGHLPSMTDAEAAVLSMMIMPVTTRCGHYLTVSSKYAGISEFADEDLCRACLRTLRTDADVQRVFGRERY